MESNSGKAPQGKGKSGGTPKAPKLAESNNPKVFLDAALKRQGLENTPSRLKESWTEGDYKYEVRIHEANPEYGKPIAYIE